MHIFIAPDVKTTWPSGDEFHHPVTDTGTLPTGAPDGAAQRMDERQVMSTITAAMVKELREKSGAGMMDCKKALAETDGDMAAAIDWLRAKGI